MSNTPETDKIAHAGLPERAYISEMTHKARKLERERDEARNDRNAALYDRDAWARLCGAADCYTPSTAEPYEALKIQLDELRAEVERLKADAELYSGWSKWKDGIWRISHPESGPMAEWIAEDIEELKADKKRLDWLESNSHEWDILLNGKMIANSLIRDAIDAAMKGVE